MTREDRIKMLKYRCWHRGCKETDIMFGQFGDAHLDSFNDQELDWFEALCNASDWDIYNWVTGKEPLPAEWDNSVSRKLLAFDFSKAFKA